MTARAMQQRLVLAAAGLVLSACVAGPDYRPPELADEGGWTLDPAADAAAGDPSWQVFDDPRLDELIEKAQRDNLELRRALARLAESRALRAGVAGGRWPAVDARGSVTRRRLSETGALPAGRVPGVDTYQTIFELGFDASWELDVFGRTRSAIAAADADVGRSAAELADLRLSVAAEVARNYLELQSAKLRLEALRRAVAAAADSLRLTVAQVEAGERPPADRARAEAELAALEARLPEVEATARSRALALAALQGEPPGAQLGLLTEPAILAALAPMPVGERADVLRRRADVRAAERRLAAAAAGVNTATAEWFPRLAVGASGGFESLEADTLFDRSSRALGLAPRFSWRIFDGGRVRAEIDASEARFEQAAFAYEEAVLGALTEAEQSLARYRYALDALARQQEVLAAARSVQQLLAVRERAGDASPLELLQADGEVAESEQALALAHGEAATRLVALVKSLGGGWTDDAAAGGAAAP